MITTDNNGGKLISKLKKESEEVFNKRETIKDLKAIAKIDFNNIKTEKYPSLFLFPNNEDAEDSKKNKKIFSIKNNKVLKTGNVLGFVGRNNTHLTITSRFSYNENENYFDKNNNFLHYMLSKILCINLVDFKTKSGNEGILDLLILLFPYYLNKALVKGLYKEYKRNEYNDSNVKGVIDVKRHLRINIPFAGKVAYSVREYSYDNPVMQLIRHTIEYIKTHPLSNILNNDTKNNYVQIMQTTPNYNRNNKYKVLNMNKKKPVVHPYFTEYKELQKLCISILSYDKLSVNQNDDDIHGILFRCDWLWEEYLNTILGDGFIHKRSDRGQGFKIFQENENNSKTGRLCPDFIRESDNLIIDAKYKRLNDKVANGDYFQLLSYMLRFDSNKGCLVFPLQGAFKNVTKTLLKGRNNEKGEHQIKLLGINIPIPQTEMKFDDFSKMMKDAEKLLIKSIKEFK